MNRFPIFTSVLAAGVMGVVVGGRVWAGGGGKVPLVSGPERVDAAAGEPDLWTGENVNLGGVLFPHFHFHAVYGRTTSDLGHELGTGHHDPVADGWTVQGFEVGLSARVGEYFEAFGTYHGYWENEDPNDYGDEFEEWFGKIKNLPGGFELRGGRYLNRFGLHNSTHLHGWDWVDNYLVNGRFLGDDGQYSIGGEVTWNLPIPWASVLSVSVGEAQVEAHGHGADEHGEEHVDEHGDEHAETLFEAGEALFAETLTTANWTNMWNLNDFNQFRGGFSGAWGDNGSGRTSQVYGTHFQYEWRRNGLEAGGAYFRWRTEALVRNFKLVGHEDEPGGGHEDEHGHEEEHGPEEELGGGHGEGGGRNGSWDDWGIYTSVSYGHPLGAGVLEAALRYDYVNGVGEAGLAERWRLSPGITWYANTQRTFYIRAQYNHDWIEGHGTEDSAWIGFGFNWGGPEVR